MSDTYLIINRVPRHEKLAEALQLLDETTTTFPIEHLIMSALLAKQYSDDNLYLETIQEILDYQDYDQFTPECQQAIETVVDNQGHLITAVENRLSANWFHRYCVDDVRPFQNGYMIKLVPYD